MDERSKEARYAALEKIKRERILSSLFEIFDRLSRHFRELEITTEGQRKLIEDLRGGLQQLLELEGFVDQEDLKTACQQALIQLRSMSDSFSEEESLKYWKLVRRIVNFFIDKDAQLDALPE